MTSAARVSYFSGLGGRGFRAAGRALADHLAAIGDAEGAEAAYARHIKAATKDPRFTYLHAVTTANYCGPQATIPGTSNLSTDCPNQINSYPVGNAPNGPEAPSGTRLPAYGLFDLSTGVERNNLTVQFAVTNLFDERAQLTRFVQCTTTTCAQPYIIPAQPRTFLLKFGQKF